MKLKTKAKIETFQTKTLFVPLYLT